MPRRDQRTQHRLHRLASVAVVATFGLILAGALVTSRNAGLAVPDWPLSFGTVNPPRWYTIENVRTEHGHRLAAALVAMVTVALGLAIHRASDDRPLRVLGAAAVALVLLQAILGGLRVLQLSIDLAMVHGWLGQAFLCVLVAIATRTSPRWCEDRTAAVSTETRRWSLAVSITIVVQLVLGILVRHREAPLLAYAPFLAHVGAAVLIVWLSVHLRRSVSPTAGPLGRWPSTLVGLICLQAALGVFVYAVVDTAEPHRQASLLESWLPSFHVAVGAAVLATSVTILVRVLPRASHAAAVGVRVTGREVTQPR